MHPSAPCRFFHAWQSAPLNSTHAKRLCKTASGAPPRYRASLAMAAQPGRSTVQKLYMACPEGVAACAHPTRRAPAPLPVLGRAQDQRCANSSPEYANRSRLAPVTKMEKAPVEAETRCADGLTLWTSRRPALDQRRAKSLNFRVLPTLDPETVSRVDWMVVVEAVSCEPISACRTGNF
jgi:hypothetical protein